MTLVKAKHKAPPHYRKVTGEHHRKGQKYMKTYWPYLPIVLILGGAFLGNEYLPSSLSSNSSNSTSVYSSRVGSLVGSGSDLLLGLLYVLLVILLAWYVVRHFKRVKALVLDGERYLTQHYVLDIAAALLIGGLYILVR